MRAEKLSVVARSVSRDDLVAPRTPSHRNQDFPARRRRAIAECVVECTEQHTLWDSDALLVRIDGRGVKRRVVVRSGTPQKEDVDEATWAMLESCRLRQVPLEVFQLRSRAMAPVQARCEVWRDMRERGIGYLAIEWVTNFSHANVVKAMKVFTPTFEILNPGHWSDGT